MISGLSDNPLADIDAHLAEDGSDACQLLERISRTAALHRITKEESVERTFHSGCVAERKMSSGDTSGGLRKHALVRSNLYEPAATKLLVVSIQTNFGRALGPMEADPAALAPPWSTAARASHAVTRGRRRRLPLNPW